MTVSDKALSVANNVLDVYTSGELAILDESQYMHPTVSGEAIAVNDVNPVEHKLSVRVRSGNLFDMSAISNTSYLTNNGDNSITIKAGRYSCSTSKKLKDLCPTLKVGDVCILSAESQGAKIINLLNVSTWGFGASKTITQEMLDATVYLYGVSQSTEDIIIKNIKIEPGTEATPYTPYIPDLSSVEVSRYGKNLWNERWINGMYSTSTGNIAVSSAVNKSCVASDPNYPITVLPNTDYYIVQPYDLSVYAFFYDKDDNWISYKGVSFTTHLVTTPEDCKYIRFYVNTNYGNVYLNDICVSLSGDEYEPYKTPQTATANSDGTVEGLTSIPPNMTLLTNTNGVVIDCQYYRDIDLYIDNQITDIALTGGV